FYVSDICGEPAPPPSRQPWEFKGMQERLQFYIGGKWVNPTTPKTIDVINPATEEPFARISMGSKADVDKAVAAARKAFETYSRTTREERLAMLQKILGVYQSKFDEIAKTISQEMGAPMWLSKAAQAATGMGHLAEAIKILKDYKFEEMQGTTAVVKEPVGVCGFITPWNWPINQIVCKVAPMNAMLFADVLHEAGVPPGVFNLVNGDGPTVGEAMSSHPGIDMMSFTGSTRAGIAVAKAAADTVKRVAQELGGKSANIVLEDADLTKAVSGGVMQMMTNSGQSCNAPSRMFVPKTKNDQAFVNATATAEKVKVAPPDSAESTPGTIGPVVSEVQFNKIQALIKKGIDEGATLVAGGLGRPEGLNRGYYVKLTVFANVTNDMTIAREEIFGPVLTMLAYDTEEDAIRMANDTVYGLSGYVQSGDIEHARKVASRIRSGNVHLNGAGADFS